MGFGLRYGESGDEQVAVIDERIQSWAGTHSLDAAFDVFVIAIDIRIGAIDASAQGLVTRPRREESRVGHGQELVAMTRSR